MADRTQEERDEVDARRRAAQEKARARRKAEKEKKNAPTEPKGKKETPKKSSSSAPEKSRRPAPRPNQPKPKPKPETRRQTTERKAPARTDAEESKRRANPKGVAGNRRSSQDIVPMAAAAGAAATRRGGVKAPLQIRQRPIPFDSGVSRGTGVGPVRRPNPGGGGLYMLNQGSPFGGGPRGLPRPRNMSKGGMVKKKC